MQKLYGLDIDDNDKIRYFIKSYVGLGDIAFIENKYDESLVYYNHVLSLLYRIHKCANHQKFTKIYIRMASVYEKQKNHEVAFAYYTRAYNSDYMKKHTKEIKEKLDEYEKLGY